MDRGSREKNKKNKKQSLNKARLEKKKKEMASTKTQNDNYRLLVKAHRDEEKTAVRTTPNISPNIATLA